MPLEILVEWLGIRDVDQLLHDFLTIKTFRKEDDTLAAPPDEGSESDH